MNTQPGKILITREQIADKVRQLAAAITRDYRGQELIVVSILKGSLYFTMDLTREIELPLQLDLMEISHYPDEGQSGVIRVTRDLEFSIADKKVLIVENIINTGLTHSYLMKNLKARNPGSLSICALLNRTGKRLVELPIDYSGFEIPDKFVVGYGLDYRENYRHLPYIAEFDKK